MSNPYSQRVNRQLLLAQQQLETAVDTSNASGRLRQAGIFESALFHLYRAYLEMLRELADNYQLARPELLTNLSELSDSLKAVDKTPAEVQELVELARNGFLSDLLSSWESLFQGAGGVAHIDAASVKPEGLISARQISDEALDREKIQGWINSFREVSDRHRDIMVEY